MVANVRRPQFPFTALVGQERMQLALLLNAVNPRLGGVLIRGEKGTAKSTAVRALAGLLPEIAVVDGCPYGCDPDDPAALCDDCAERAARGEVLPRRRRRAPMVELPVGATADRVVGTLDLEGAIQEGQRRFEPGLLAQANRGVLSIDEVNLLPDHLVDTLLDVAAMGRNYVERDGVSLSHPAEFLLVGTMNPEEGELRPQLLDRFALMVEVQGLPDPAARAEVVRRRIAFERDPVAFAATRAGAEAEQRERLRQARDRLPSVSLDDALLTMIVRVCAAYGVDGLRADIVMHRAATTLAALAGRSAVTVADIHEAAELALPHRRRRQPFDEVGGQQETLHRLLDEHQPSEPATSDAPERRQGDTRGEDDAPPADGHDGASPAGGVGSPDAQAAGNVGGAEDGAPAVPAPDRVARPQRSGAAMPSPSRSASPRLASPSPGQTARRGAFVQESEFGMDVGSRPPVGAPCRLALPATLRAAAPRQPQRRAAEPAGGPLVRLQPQDLREPIRRGRAGNLVLFALDASGSMGVADRMALTKGAILSLLLDAYRSRDRVGLIVFRDAGARLILPPTSSVVRAEHVLTDLPTGGTTPLASALILATAVLEHGIRQGDRRRPSLVLLTDGRANVGPAGVAPFAAALRAALTAGGRIAAWGGQALVIDTEAGRTRLGLARELARALAARYMPLAALQVSGRPGLRLDRAVRGLVGADGGKRTFQW